MSNDAVLVDFKMRRERHPEGNKQEFWIKVTAEPQSPDVQEIKIDLYQSLSMEEGGYTPYGPMLEPYPMTSGTVYTWDFTDGDVVVVIVRYLLSDDPFWKVAASGVWMSDGNYFQSGKRLSDRSELFANAADIEAMNQVRKRSREEFWRQHQHEENRRIGNLPGSREE